MTVGRTVRVLIALLVAAGLLALAAVALTPTLKDGVEKVVGEYLRRNPEVLIEAVKAFHDSEEVAERERIQNALAENRDQLENDPTSPVGGNPEGDVTLVEFFDYRCGYCKRVFPSVVELLNSDGNLRFVFKEYPILGEASVKAARAAQAAWRLDRDKYFAFHTALMNSKGGLSEKRILKIAAESGLDADRLGEAMDDPGIDKILQRNFKLADALGIGGTPAFVIGDHLIPGAVDLETLRELVAAERGG